MQTALAAGMTENVEAGKACRGVSWPVTRAATARGPSVRGRNLAGDIPVRLSPRLLSMKRSRRLARRCGPAGRFRAGAAGGNATGIGRAEVDGPLRLFVRRFSAGKQPGSLPRNGRWFRSSCRPTTRRRTSRKRRIESLLVLDYPRYEVIVVDDGSTDDTYGRGMPGPTGDVRSASIASPTAANGAAIISPSHARSANWFSASTPTRGSTRCHYAE